MRLEIYRTPAAIAGASLHDAFTIDAAPKYVLVLLPISLTPGSLWNTNLFACAAVN